jgi:hypothetical protein
MLGIKQSLREGTYPFSIGDDSRRGPYGLLRESVKFQDGHINQALSPMTGLCFFFSNEQWSSYNHCTSENRFNNPAN